MAPETWRVNPENTSIAPHSKVFCATAAPDSMDPIISTGLNGILDGYRRASESAERIVQAFASERAQDAFGALFDLQAARRQVEASAKVVKTGNQLLGNVLDIFA